MMRIFVLTAVLTFAGAAAAQDPHAGHAGMQKSTLAPSGIVTTPADGAMTHGSPERFSVTFPHPMILKTVTLTGESQTPIVVAAPPAPAVAVVSVALPPLAPGAYTAVWTAEAPDGHKMSGSISFMVH
ncbi:MAG: copper resistance protein CopC [Proteobacteria bacterium]|nr:copper resistance protein CopC [Pseudomonadota bacterium]